MSKRWANLELRDFSCLGAGIARFCFKRPPERCKQTPVWSTGTRYMRSFLPVFLASFACCWCFLLWKCNLRVRTRSRWQAVMRHSIKTNYVLKKKGGKSWRSLPTRPSVMEWTVRGVLAGPRPTTTTNPSRLLIRLTRLLPCKKSVYLRRRGLAKGSSRNWTQAPKPSLSNTRLTGTTQNGAASCPWVRQIMLWLLRRQISTQKRTYERILENRIWATQLTLFSQR